MAAMKLKHEQLLEFDEIFAFSLKSKVALGKINVRRGAEYQYLKHL
jgi:hypothetical protein